jgi:polyhydroxybutyrate depolymerase
MKPWLRNVVLMLGAVVGMVALVVLTVAVVYLVSDRTNGKMTVSTGEMRRFLLYVPESYDPATSVPLVISIHGYMDMPSHQESMTGWNELAEENGFIVVYPAGLGFPKHWRASGGTEAEAMYDVIFINELIDKLESEYNIDPARIYVNGLSNGAGMTFRLGCELPGRIAAVGLVAGAYLLPWSECQNERPVPAVVFHGTADPVVPYTGGPSHSFDIPFPDIPGWVETLAAHNGCSPEASPLPTSGAVSAARYGDCSGQAEVIFYSIEGGGHTWPGGEPLPEFITGITNMDIDATRVMWDFFQAHPLPGGE